MRVQFASDLHLNTWKGPVMETKNKETQDEYFYHILEPKAKILVLCGDIGHPDSAALHFFFEWAAPKWERIFWIPGHHEMTDVWHTPRRSYDENLNHMRFVVRNWTNIEVLHRDSFVTEDGFLFLACPLWARLTAMSEEMSRDPIYQDITRHYEQDLAWLKQQIQMAERPVVVATHYPPTYSLMNAAVLNEPLAVPFALETEVFIRPPVVAWLCGYAHKAFIVQRPYMEATGKNGEVLIVCNPRGYPDDIPTDYRSDAVLRLSQTGSH